MTKMSNTGFMHVIIQLPRFLINPLLLNIMFSIRRREVYLEFVISHQLEISCRIAISGDADILTETADADG